MLQRLRNNIVSFSGFISATLLVPMVIIAIVQVASRYLTDNPVTFTEELLRFLLIWSAMLGSVYCFGTERHLALSFLAEMVPNKSKIFLDILTRILILTFCTTILIGGGVRIVLATTEQLSATMRIPMSYVYSILPLSGVLILLIVGIDLVDKIQIFIQNKGGQQ